MDRCWNESCARRICNYFNSTPFFLIQWEWWCFSNSLIHAIAALIHAMRLNDIDSFTFILSSKFNGKFFGTPFDGVNMIYQSTETKRLHFITTIINQLRFTCNILAVDLCYLESLHWPLDCLKLKVPQFHLYPMHLTVIPKCIEIKLCPIWQH